MRADTVEMRSIEWVDKPLLQGSAFTSSRARRCRERNWIARMSRRDAGRVRAQRNVLIVSSEDSAAIDT